MEPNNEQELNSIQLRQTKEKRTVIEQLEKTPIIQIACERASIGRATFYRWREQDKEFDKAVKKALSEGEIFINELSETQLITLIKEKNWPSISFWLRNHDPKYTQRIEISTPQPQEKLDPEQEAVVREALRLAGLTTSEEKMVDNNAEKISTNKKEDDSTKQRIEPDNKPTTPAS